MSAAIEEVSDEGIGAVKRQRKKPPTKVEPVEAITAKEAAKETKPVGHQNDSKGCNNSESTKTFDLDYTDNRGFHWSGSFTTHILTIGERASVGLTRSRMCGGVAIDAIDETTLSMLEMQAHLAVCLDLFPSWADDLSQIRDVGVLAAIYGEVAEHEATFWQPKSETVRS